MKVEIEHMDFGYSSGGQVLHDINLTLEEPGLYCIVGPNGVGKSTLIKCINKLLKPTAGEVRLNGRNVAEMTLKEIAQYIGYVPVKSQDMFSLPVIDTVLMGTYNRNKWKTNADDLRSVHRVMNMLGIEELAMKGFNELSAGQHQKVAIARGIVQQPQMLILDEPTSNLDVKHQAYVTELLRGLSKQEDMIILMISHDLNITAKYAHQVIVMSEPGKIYDVGTPEETITKAMVEEVYGIEAEIIQSDNRPHVVLGSALSL